MADLQNPRAVSARALQFYGDSAATAQISRSMIEIGRKGGDTAQLAAAYSDATQALKEAMRGRSEDQLVELSAALATAYLAILQAAAPAP